MFPFASSTFCPPNVNPLKRPCDTAGANIVVVCKWLNMVLTVYALCVCVLCCVVYLCVA